MRKHKVAAMVWISLLTCTCLFAAGIWNLNDEEITGNWTFNSTPIFNKTVTFNGTVNNTDAVNYTSTFTLTDADGVGTITVKGYEAYDALALLYADEGDDNADKWGIRSEATGNHLAFENNGTDKVTISSGGDITATGGDVIGANSTFIDIGEDAAATIALSRATAGDVTMTSADNDANANLIVAAGGTGALTLGDTGSTCAISSSDWAIGATGTITNCSMSRDQLLQEDLASYLISPYDLHHTAAPVGEALFVTPTSGNHFIDYASGVFAAYGNAPSSSTVTDASAFQFSVPPEYVAGQTITIRVNGLITDESDPALPASKSLDIACYEINKTDGSKGSDLSTTTAAQTLTTSAAAYDFVITPTAVAAGDLLTVIVTTVFEDQNGSTGKAKINTIEVLLDIKG